MEGQKGGSALKRERSVLDDFRKTSLLNRNRKGSSQGTGSGSASEPLSLTLDDTMVQLLPLPPKTRWIPPNAILGLSPETYESSNELISRGITLHEEGNLAGSAESFKKAAEMG